MKSKRALQLYRKHAKHTTKSCFAPCHGYRLNFMRAMQLATRLVERKLQDASLSINTTYPCCVCGTGQHATVKLFR